MVSNDKHTSSMSHTDETTHTKKTIPWLKWLFPITGMFALLWFLIRVIPKPSRATYPCQRAAFPLASAFVIWLIGLAGSVTVLRKAILLRAQGRKVLAAAFIAVSVTFLWMAMNHSDQQVAYAHEPIVANEPMGQGKGIFPGRVAWIHDPAAANWLGDDGNTRPPYWYEDVSTDPVVVSNMLSNALQALTGKNTDALAWDAIFKQFNHQMGRGYVGYTPGQKIAIKINSVLTMGNGGRKPSDRYDQIDNAPQLVIALLKQLTDVVGVNPGDISIGDPQGGIANYWYDMVSAACPGVVYLSSYGYDEYGRVEVSGDPTAPFYWSDPDPSHHTETKTDYIPTHFAQADYFINCPILKSHNDGGITLGGKNHYGSLMRAPTAWSGPQEYYDMHLTRATERPGMGHYRAIVDLLGHPQLGGKTMLTLLDGLYAGRSWDSHPIRWNMAPFNGHWPSSIFLSQDPIAADSVAFDFMDYEWDADPSNPNDLNSYPQKSGAADYLHEAALIPNPPSGTNYDPAHTGGLTKSLGVHEHWNNAIDKQYSRNLDPLNGTGIELVTGPTLVGDLYRDGTVDLKDFAIFAAAWNSQPGDDNWNPACDISIPADGIINVLDLYVLTGDWLSYFVPYLIQPGATLEVAYSDSTGGVTFEGPTWNPGDNRLYFSKASNYTYQQILRLNSPGNVTAWLNPSPQTNGTFLSIDGRLLTCDESTKQIRSLRIDASGPGDPIVLADAASWPDIWFGKPNDICQLDNGNIYFTTPSWDGLPIAQQGIFLLEPDGTVTRVNNALDKPNGVIASLNGKKLYVAESGSGGNGQWRVFNIALDGTLDAGTVFFKPDTLPSPNNVPDGMTIDEFGNLYFSGFGGVWIVSPQGELLEFIDTPTDVFNVTFGGSAGKTLYMTCQNGVYSLAMYVRGARWTPPVPDFDPPSPTPMEWADGGEPAATADTRITMTAVTATDLVSPTVEYYFECTTDPSVSSTWQISPSYTTPKLKPKTSYTFQVKARDNAYPTPNETGWSIPASATTDEAPLPVNLLDNGTFEGSGSGLLTPWQPRSGGTVELTIADAHSGTYSARHYNKTQRWHGIQIAKGDLVDLQANQTYYISAWVKVTNAGADGLAPVKMTIERDNLPDGSGAGNRWYGVDLLVVNESDGWQYMEGLYTASEGTMDVSFWFEEGATMELDENGADTGAQNTDTTYAEIWVDDVYFGLAAPIPDTTILGDWSDGTTRDVEPGSNRALLLFAHAEHSNGTVTLNSVTYGGQAMTPIIGQSVGTGYTANVTAFILDEAGIAAATDNMFVPVWDTTPAAVVYTSVFLENVDQTNLFGDCAAADTTSSTTITTADLLTAEGDLVFVAVTCGNQNSYTLNNDFVEGFDQQFGDGTNGGTAAAGYKAASGVAEIPSATYNSSINRQVIIGFVVKKIAP